MNKENFNQRIEKQKPSIIKQAEIKEIEVRNKKNIENQNIELKQQQEKKENELRIQSIKDSFKDTGIIDFLEQICVDGTLPLSSYRDQIKVPIKNFWGKVTHYEHQWVYHPCSIRYGDYGRFNNNLLEINIVDIPPYEYEDSFCERLIISKNENTFNLKYENKGNHSQFKDHIGDSFEIKTENSDEILDGIAKVAAMYQLNKNK